MVGQHEIQLGKQGITLGFLENLKRRFENKTNETIKVSVLSSAREGREDVQKFRDEILAFLGEKYTARILGFSIFVKKWRKARAKSL